MIGTLITGFGFWNPLMWTVAFVTAFLISLLIWIYGESDYEKNFETIAPYLSGNVGTTEKGAIRICAGNMYWGFTKALSVYYNYLVPLHSGILNDYLSWFIIGISLLFAVVLI